MEHILWSGVEIFDHVSHKTRIDECQHQAGAGAVCSDHTQGEEETALQGSAPCSPKAFFSLLEEITHTLSFHFSLLVR